MSASKCYDCGQPAEAVEINAYGPGLPENYCRVCFIRNNFCSDDEIFVSFLDPDEDGEFPSEYVIKAVLDIAPESV